MQHLYIEKSGSAFDRGFSLIVFGGLRRFYVLGPSTVAPM